ncbi:MAG TPA: RNA polymerase sigma-54 factor, partial [Gammaproteobacteria bacterium]|nr:RNA polymerase sigma-54 factor [Gammaproteobacteria bacterium]
MTGCTAEEIGDLARKLRTFEPKPGLKFSGEFAQPVFEPDLIAYQDEEDDWIVELNRSNLPAIRVDTAYSQAVKKLDQDGSDEHFIREAITSARWLKRAIAQRNETNQKVGAEIVRYQREFLEKGIAFLRPLQLRTVADAIGVHESTVSRVTSSVMMATPQGTFPL